MSSWWNEAITPCGALYTCRAPLLQTANKYEIFLEEEELSLFCYVCSLNLGSGKKMKVFAKKTSWQSQRNLGNSWILGFFFKAKLLNYDSWEWNGVVLSCQTFPGFSSDRVGRLGNFSVRLIRSLLLFLWKRWRNARKRERMLNSWMTLPKSDGFVKPCHKILSWALT